MRGEGEADLSDLLQGAVACGFVFLDDLKDLGSRFDVRAREE